MRQITEQQILMLAPNAAAAANGKKISAKGGFVRLEHSADDTFYQGECTGSGKSNYVTSIDFIDADAPVVRCTCPSRQFPCKHGLALLYEILEGKSFSLCEIPEDIIKKREKKQAREEKKEQTEKKKPKAANSSGKAARTKKLKKQLEGLDLVQKLLQDLLQSGLGAMGSRSLTNYRQLAKQMGDYYLSGPQRLLNGLILEMEAFQKDGWDSHYETALQLLEQLYTLEKKSRQYLTEKLEQNAVELDDNELYEELGGVWKFQELEAVGLVKHNVRLLQLAFWVTYDQTRKEYIDTGCWLDLGSGTLYQTKQYRPLKALKYVKQEDSVFGVLETPMLACYPGEGTQRVRWDSAALTAASQADWQQAQHFGAAELAPEIKKAKNLLKNALSEPMVMILIAFRRIGRCNGVYVLEDQIGETIQLDTMPGMEETVQQLVILPDSSLLEGQVLLGGIFYDKAAHRIKLQPFSILTEQGVVRLLY